MKKYAVFAVYISFHKKRIHLVSLKHKQILWANPKNLKWDDIFFLLTVVLLMCFRLFKLGLRGTQSNRVMTSGSLERDILVETTSRLRPFDSSLRAPDLIEPVFQGISAAFLNWLAMCSGSAGLFSLTPNQEMGIRGWKVRGRTTWQIEPGWWKGQRREGHFLTDFYPAINTIHHLAAINTHE